MVTIRTLARLAIVLALSQVAAAEEHAHHPHWSYSGETGPAKWGSLEKEFSACSMGKAQSPIDIHADAAKIADLPAIAFDYRAAPLDVIDNGHTIQINYAPGSSITVGGKRYELVQFHFHRPSEEKINGKNFPMVAHLVHRDAEGKLAVVAVLLSSGHANAMIQALWDHLPKEKEKEALFKDVQVNAADLLPESKAYYTFTGSLTTPPCSEGVTWFVLKHPTEISTEEIGRFAKAYAMNARSVQALNGREIKTTK